MGYRGVHDPYNDMEDAVTRPDFVSGSQLSDAEKSASATTSNHSRNSASQSLRRQEQSGFTNSVQGISRATRNRYLHNRANNPNAPKGLKGFLRRFGPAGAIAGLVLGGGLFFYSSQALLGPHIVTLVTQNTDHQYTVHAYRNTRLFKFLMDGDGQLKHTGFTKKYKTFNPYLKSRLKSKGIEVGRLDTNGNFVPDKLASTEPRVLKYKDEIIDANSFTDKMAKDVDFRNDYYKAKRGRIAGFFDPIADAHYKQNGQSRDIFHDFLSTGNSKTDTENFETNVSKHVTGVDFTANTAHNRVDEDGNEIKEETGEIGNKNVAGDTPEAKAKSFINSLSSKVSTVGAPLCGALRVANIAAVTIAAIKITQSAAYFMGFSEAPSKAMYGASSSSAINEMLNFFTTPETVTMSYVDENGQEQSEEVTGSPLESGGAKLMLGQTKPSKHEMDAYAINNITRSAVSVALTNGVSTSVCNGVMASSAIVSLVSNGIPGGKLATLAVGAFMEVVGGIVMTAAVAAVINAILPHIINIFTENVFDSYKGIEAGNLYFMGAANANGRLAQDGSALMPGSEERLKEQNHKTVIALAEEAELDRLNRSPFDTTSENTFLGSIMGKLSPLSFSKNTPYVSSNLMTIVGDSIQHLTPAAMAADEFKMYSSEHHECEELPGADCDTYGIPLPTTDFSTIDISPDDPTYQSTIQKNLDENDKIKKNSELAKFITFCSNRQSPWGVQDANILNALQTDAGIIGNNLPVVGDIMDVVNAVEDKANKKWATGENCINSADNPRWDNEFKYYQLYVQDMRILDSMNKVENSGSSSHLLNAKVESSNPVLAYEQEYLEEHPIDTSYEGTLARISGNTKEDIIFLREIAKYAQFIADYQSQDHFDFNNPIEQPTDILLAYANSLDHEAEQGQPCAILLHETPLFTDKRNYIL